MYLANILTFGTRVYKEEAVPHMMKDTKYKNARVNDRRIKTFGAVDPGYCYWHYLKLNLPRQIE